MSAKIQNIAGALAIMTSLNTFENEYIRLRLIGKAKVKYCDLCQSTDKIKRYMHGNDSALLCEKCSYKTWNQVRNEKKSCDCENTTQT